MADPLDGLDPRIAKLHQFATIVDKKFGRGSIGSAKDNLVLDIPRITTGSLMFDYALGGGIPRGRITMFFGNKSGGKTTNSKRVVAQAQRLCRNCFRPAKNMVVKSVIVQSDVKDEEPTEVFYAEAECDCYKIGLFKPPRYKRVNKQTKRLEDIPITEHNARLKRYEENSFEEMICGYVDTEGAYDKEWAALLGVDNRRLMYYRPPTAEEAIDVYDPWIRTGAVDFLVMDTLAFMTPRVEVEESSENWQQGLQARLINKFTRKVASAMSACVRQWGRTPTQIWCNQVRMSIGPFGGEVIPGGKGQGFATSIEVKFRPGKPEVEKIDTGKKGEEIEVPLWTDIKFKVVKNKVAPSGIEGYYRMMVNNTETKMKSEISEDDQVFRYAKHFNLFAKADKGSGWEYDGRQFRTLDEIKAMVKGDWEEWTRLKAMLTALLANKEIE